MYQFLGILFNLNVIVALSNHSSNISPPPPEKKGSVGINKISDKKLNPCWIMILTMTLEGKEFNG